MEQGVLWWGALAALGLGVGVLAGMFGVGGGFLLTPMLAVVFRVPLDIAVGTGLCQMIGAATAAQIRYSRLGYGEAKVGWMMVAGSLLGVGLGARVVAGLDRLGAVAIAGGTLEASRLWLSVAYVLLFGGVAAWMSRDAHRPVLPADLPPLPGPLARLRLPPYTFLPQSGHRVSIPVISYIGLLIGFISGLLGVGGGVVLVPLLLYGVGMHARTAVGTGIGVLLAAALVGTAVHGGAGHVHLGMAIMLSIGSTLGAQIGATLTARMDQRKLRGLFAYLVALTAVGIAFDVLRLVLGW